MKNIFLLFLLLCALPSIAQDRQLVDEVIAKVGSEYVLLSDLEQTYTYQTAKMTDVPPNARCILLDNLMFQKLLVNQAKLDSVEVKDEEVDAQLNARVDKILGMMNNDNAYFETYYGKSVSAVKADMRNEQKDQILLERQQSKVLEMVKITPSEVKTFFDGIPKDSLPYFSAEVELSEIVIRPKVNAEERKRSIDLLESIRKRIVEGNEDFATLAKKYSADEGSGRAGGDLGFQKRGTFVLPFEAAAYNLEKGEYSGIIETEFGFHLMQMIERRGNTIHLRHILIKPKISQGDLDLSQAVLDSVRNEISKGKITFEAAVKKYSDKNQQSFSNGGRMINAQSGNTFFEVDEMDPDIYFAVDTIAVGSMTHAIEFKDQAGETYYRLIRLDSRSNPHRANLLQDFTRIKTIATESKKNEELEKWLNSKIGSTFIWINPTYSNCENLLKWTSEKQ
ncbi:MAG: peptidylprolyl isomerase [Saprospiraceae bacterium]